MINRIESVSCIFPKDNMIFGDDTPTQIYVALNLIATIFGCISSVICILLVYRMKLLTGHIKLVLYLSYYQFLYDFFCFQNNADVDYNQKNFAIFIHVISGIASSFISNWIAFSAFYIVAYQKTFDVLKNFHWIHASALIPGIMNGIVFAVAVFPESSANDDLSNTAILYAYNNIRLGSIAVNFFFVAVILYKIHAISSKNINIKSEQEIAIQTLAHRMILYPVVQAIGRSGYAWYEFSYGSNVSASNASSDEYACLIFLSLITPFVSVGYLIIFLMMQPKAYEHFKALIKCQIHEEELRDNSLFDDRRQCNDKPFTAADSESSTTAPSGSSSIATRPTNTSTDERGTRGTSVASSVEQQDIQYLSSGRDSMSTAAHPSVTTTAMDQNTFADNTINNNAIRASDQCSETNHSSFLASTDFLLQQRSDDELYDILNRQSLTMQFMQPTGTGGRTLRTSQTIQSQGGGREDGDSFTNANNNNSFANRPTIDFGHSLYRYSEAFMMSNPFRSSNNNGQGGQSQGQGEEQGRGEVEDVEIQMVENVLRGNNQ